MRSKPLDSRIVRVIPFEEAVAASQAADAAKNEREFESYLRTLEFRARWLDQPRPANVAQLDEEIRGFRRQLIDGYQADFLAIGRDVVRHWWDCMRRLNMDPMPDMPPILELPLADAFADVITDHKHLDQLQAAVDLVIRCCAEQAPAAMGRDQTRGKQGEGPGVKQQAKGKPKCGAPRIYNQKDDAKLIENWKAAKREGETRPHFCRNHGIELQGLINAQQRYKYYRGQA